MQEVSKDIFYKTVEDWAWVSHTQFDAMCRGIVPNDTLHYFLDNQQPASIGCVGYVRHKAGLHMLIIPGECIRGEISHKLIHEFYHNIGQLGYDIVEINSDYLYSPEFEMGIREAGLLRPVGLFSTTLSKEIDLQKPLVFDKSWQRNLKKNDQSGLTFQIYRGGDVPDHILSEYMHIHQEMTSRKQFSDGLDISQLRILLTDKHFVLGIIRHDEKVIAGMVAFMDEGKRAKSLYSATSIAGRELSASYILYREMMLYAANELHIPVFDLGRISPSSHAKNNLFLFKNGIKGSVVQYNGEWLWCKRKWMPLALYFMKKYIWKRVQV